MEDSTSQAVAEFREELALWLKEAFVSDIAEALSRGDARTRFSAHREWNATLFDAGYAAPRWPERFGGRDASRGPKQAERWRELLSMRTGWRA